MGRKAEASESAAQAPAKTLGRKTDALAATPVKALARTADAGGAARRWAARRRRRTSPRRRRRRRRSGAARRGHPGRTCSPGRWCGRRSPIGSPGSSPPGALATWARAQFLEVQRGAPAESGYRDMLEDSLQSLTLSTLPASRLSDEQLVDLMTQLEG